MSLKLSGVTLGNITGGPSSLNLSDLHDVSIVSPVTGQYLRYNSGISEWQNSIINYDVFTSLAVANGVTVSYNGGTTITTIGLAAITPTSVAASGTVTGSNLSGTNTGDQTITLTGDVTGTGTGSFATTLANTAVTPSTYGSATQVPVLVINSQGRITSASTVAFGGTSPLATSLAGGTAGSLPYQSAASTTSFLSAGTSSQVLVSGTSPSWTNAPTLTGTNFTSIPNTGLINSAITIGSTSVSLGSTATTITGLTSVTSTTFVGSLVGNASTATALSTARTIGMTGDVTWTSSSFDGTANVSGTSTLATVTQGSGANFAKFTLDTKGRVIGNSAVASGDIISALGYTPVNDAGDTMTGALILNADPLTALGAATKQYVDNIASGLNAHAACATSTTATLASSSAGTITYNNGTAGVGATLTTTGSFATIGAYSTTNGDRILVKDEATQANNGVYVRTSTTVLTRASDFDDSPDGEIAAGDFVYIQNGTLGGTQWVQTTSTAIVIGTTSIVFSQLSGAGAVTGGTGITVTGNSVALATGNTLSLFNLGTNGLVARTAANTVAARSIAVSGTGLSVTNADASAGNPTITSNATNANTASTIVARDASGNFSAGTITASLTGASSLNVLKAGDTMTGNLVLNNEIYISGKTNTSFTTRMMGINAGNNIYMGSLDIATGGDWIFTNGGERMRITAGGQVLLGASSSRGNIFGSASGLDTGFQIEGTTFATSSALHTRDSADTNASYMVLAKTRSATVGGNTAVVAADALGIVSFQGADGTNIVNAAEVRGSADLTPSTGIVPGRLGFWTANSSGTMTERMRINSLGNAGINTTPSATSKLTVGGGLTVSGSAVLPAALGPGTFSLESSSLRAYVGDGTGYNWNFSRRASGSTTDLMTILDTGNVGIGGAPTFTLDVLTSNPRIRIAPSVGTNSALLMLANTGGTSYIGLDSSTGGLGAGAYSLNLHQGGAYPIVMSTSGTERMRITAAGDVGIATTPTAGYRLHVSGDSLLSNIKIHASDAISRASAGAIYIGYENANNLIFNTTTTSGIGTERLRITGAGGVSFGSSGTSYGSAGQSLVSAGNAPPTWSNSLVGTLSDTTSSYRIVSPAGGTYFNGSSVDTGAIKIVLPMAGMPGQMFRMTIKCYEYVTNESFEIHVGGYPYPVGNTWANNPFAYIVGNPNIDRRFTVRFGYTSGGKGVIYVGELASTWSYLNFYITDVQVGYSGTGAAWTSGWTLGFEPTAFENVTATITNPQVGYQATTNVVNSVVLRDGSGNFTAGTITATVFNATSTADVKDDIVDISESYLDRFDQLRPREYNRTDYTAHEFGFIAEEMESIYPEVVGKNADGKPTGIDYGKLSTILTAKVQQQQSVINNLQDQVAKIMELLQGTK